MAGKAKSQLKFQKKLVLNQWLISLFGVKDFEELASALKDEQLEAYDDTRNASRFCLDIVNRRHASSKITEEEVLEFDRNITQHTKEINKDRRKDKKIQWKYFQYLALLFMEIYLDRYFRDPVKLREDLNNHVNAYNRNKVTNTADHITPFEDDDLRRIAFFQATGSGKTLQMHINIKQYQYYLQKYKHKINRIILLTPNHGLSQQHLEEFKKSNMHDAVLFKKGGLGPIVVNQHIEIIDIHKLAEKSGEKTVAVESFESNNLVLVDEGHRGLTGEQWLKMRRILSRDGFTIEYSATFEQAVSTSAGKKIEQLYAKSILFNYSYPYFYNDGYGKDYKILNLDETTDEDRTKRRVYLTACLLTFYQQMQYFDKNPPAVRNFNIEKPLLVLVGNSVNAVRTEGGETVSDIMSYLVFLGNFIKNKEQSIADIQSILEGDHGMLAEGKNVFANAFDYIENLGNARETFADMKQQLFNAEDGVLRIEHLKGSDGEIALRLGETSPFGVINVGDASKLADLCKEKNEDAFVVQNREFSESYFRHIGKTGSSINILMGSKKFKEGWNSWRVSTMGFMNIGRSEGSEIIQLFGRGVRLKGKNFNLKRSDGDNSNNRHIKKMETLNIFGIRASYMEQFDKFLAQEGLSNKGHPEEIILPVLCHDVVKQKKLKILRLKKGMNYKKDAPCPILKAEEEYFNKNKIIVNWYPRIQAKISQTSDMPSSTTSHQEQCFQEKHFAFLDINQLFFEIESFKSQSDWYNIILSKKAIRKLLLNDSLYTIEIPKEKMEFSNNISEDIRRWQEIATVVLKKYVEKFYKFRRTEWEHSYLEYQSLEKEDANLLWDETANDHQYIFTVEKNETRVIEKIKELKTAIKEGKLEPLKLNGDACAFLTSEHLYKPLIYIGEKIEYIKVKPVALNDGEKTFVENLTKDIEDRKPFFADKEMYLLRNQGRGNGIGFFEDGGFYPDFILWILHEKKQYINFIDPHGLRQSWPNDPKLKLYKKIKNIENRLHETDNSISLNAFVVSTTPYKDLRWKEKRTIDDLQNKNIFFQEGHYIEYMINKILSPDLASEKRATD